MHAEFSKNASDGARENAKKAGLKAIDHLIITHWHTDHYGGVGHLSKLIPIRAFYDRGIPDTLVHGDFHPGNILWRDEGPHIVIAVAAALTHARTCSGVAE